MPEQYQGYVKVADLLSGDGPEIVERPAPSSYWGWGLLAPPAILSVETAVLEPVLTEEAE